MLRKALMLAGAAFAANAAYRKYRMNSGALQQMNAQDGGNEPADASSMSDGLGTVLDTAELHANNDSAGLSAGGTPTFSPERGPGPMQ